MCIFETEIKHKLKFANNLELLRRIFILSVNLWIAQKEFGFV